MRPCVGFRAPQPPPRSFVASTRHHHRQCSVRQGRGTRLRLLWVLPLTAAAETAALAATWDSLSGVHLRIVLSRSPLVSRASAPAGYLGGPANEIPSGGAVALRRAGRPLRCPGTNPQMHPMTLSCLHRLAARHVEPTGRPAPLPPQAAAEGPTLRRPRRPRRRCLVEGARAA